MTISIEYEMQSVSMPKATVAEVRDPVGNGEFSAYVTDAVQRQLRRDALAEILGRIEAKHGTVDEAKIAETMERLAS